MYKSKREVWNLEKYLASKPAVWLSKAHDLQCSVRVMLSYDETVHNCIWKDKTQPPLPPFWTAGVIRMLMGFALENLIKAIILQNPSEFAKAFAKEGNLSWGRDGHNLIKLASLAGISATKIEQRYLELWQTCSLWAGRYPIAINETGFPPQRKGIPTREALIKRRQKSIEKAIKEGDPFMGVEINDMIHNGVGTQEATIFMELYSRLTEILPK